MSIDSSVRWRWIQAGIVVGIVLVAIALIVPAVQQAREAVRRSQSRNNLRQLGVAFDNYHESHKMLPYGGIFDERGTPFHGWTTALLPYLAAIPPYGLPDPDFPWDDPVNLERAFHQYVMPFQNPSVAERTSIDGLPLSHYAANQRLFYRNSVVRLGGAVDKSATALVGDCNGNFIPIGYPYHWRDLSAGIGTTPDAFGCPTRDGTMFLVADESVRWLNNRADAAAAKTLAGTGLPEPRPEQVTKPKVPYRLKTREYWRYRNLVSDHRRVIAFCLAPDGKYLEATFTDHEPRGFETAPLGPELRKFVKVAAVEHVELKGELSADEIMPFLELPTVKRLTISGAKIVGNTDGALAGARNDIIID